MVDLVVAQGARLLEHLAAHRARQSEREKPVLVVDPDPQLFAVLWIRIRNFLQCCGSGSGAFFLPGIRNRLFRIPDLESQIPNPYF